MKINDEGRINAAHWYERAMKAEARIKPLEETVAAQYAHNVLLEVRLQKIMARCADLLDEDQFNELDAMVTGQPSREIIQQAKECGCGICDACVAASRPR